MSPPPAHAQRADGYREEVIGNGTDDLSRHLIVAFIGIAIWRSVDGRKARFERHAHIPFDADNKG